MDVQVSKVKQFTHFQKALTAHLSLMGFSVEYQLSKGKPDDIPVVVFSTRVMGDVLVCAEQHGQKIVVLNAGALDNILYHLSQFKYETDEQGNRVAPGMTIQVIDATNLGE